MLLNLRNHVRVSKVIGMKNDARRLCLGNASLGAVFKWGFEQEK